MLSIAIIDPTAPSALTSLVEKLRAAFPGCTLATANVDDPADVDMVVNASPVGMRPDDGLPGDIGPLAPERWSATSSCSDRRPPIIQHACVADARRSPAATCTAGRSKRSWHFFAATSHACA